MAYFPVASYALAFLAFAILSVLLVINWKRQLVGALLVSASLLTAVWAGLIAVRMAYGQPDAAVTAVFEALRSIAWASFLLLLVYQAGLRRRGPVLAAILLLCLLPFLLPLAGVVLPTIGGADLRILMLILLQIAQLLLIEQVYRNSEKRQQWKLRYFLFAIAGMAGYDLVMYSDAVLNAEIDALYFAVRGVVVMLVAPLLAVSVARNPQWNLDLFVSRNVVFQSSAIFLIGIYLLVMGVVGYYINALDVSWAGYAKTIFSFGALMALGVLVASENVRLALKVFISKNFYNYKYDYRDEWLKLTQQFAAADSDAQLYRAAVSSLSEIVHSSGGALWTERDAAGVWELMYHNEALPALPPLITVGDDDFFSTLAAREWIYENGLTGRAADRQGELGAAPDWFVAQDDLWLLIPLKARGRAIGLVTLGRSKVFTHLNWEVLDLLRIASAQVSNYVAQLSAARRLGRAEKFEHYNKMTTFFLHDLKNISAQLGLMLKNAEKYKEDREFVDDMLETVGNAHTKIDKILNQLKAGRVVSGEAGEVDVAGVLRAVVGDKPQGAPEVEFADSGDAIIVRGVRAHVQSVFEHVLQNARDAVGNDGRVRVTMKKEGPHGVIEVADDGVGMSDEFIRNRLYSPFDSTKDGNAMGIGMYQVREYIMGLGGNISVASEPGAGTTFTIVLPLLRD